MNELLFYALLIALLYYFLVYLPQQKKLTANPLTHSQSTQTEPETDPELENTLDDLITSIRQLNNQLK